ncbi:MAG: ABC transporter ATP-binding protein [Chlamydiota bacterium]
MTLLLANKLCKSFGKSQILRNVSLSLNQGESLAIQGRSGEGKTTLLHVLAGYESFESGSLTINGIDVAKDPLSIRRKWIGFVFQARQLLDEFSVLDNLLMPHFIAQMMPHKEALKRADELLAFLGLQDKKKEKARILSGGEKQRVAIGRALLNSPPLLFADEPTGSLDSDNAEQVHELLFEGAKRYRKSLVIATHDEMLASLCQQKRLLRSGILH